MEGTLRQIHNLWFGTGKHYRNLELIVHDDRLRTISISVVSIPTEAKELMDRPVGTGTVNGV